jgi:hypothetical protein
MGVHMSAKILFVLALFLVFPFKMLAFDHSYRMWNEVLSTQVQDGLVDYESIKNDPKNLDMFVTQAAAVTEDEFKSWSHSQQLAYLINLYNAVTMQIVIDDYPIESFKDIGGIFKDPWKMDRVPLFRQMVSLDYLEHDVINAGYQDPRVHFALTYAAKGSPNLRSHAYMPDSLDQQLEKQTTLFLRRSPQKNHYDSDTNTLYLSPLIKWYAKDFERAAGKVIDYVRQYVASVKSDATIKYIDFDWALNDQ